MPIPLLPARFSGPSVALVTLAAFLGWTAEAYALNNPAPENPPQQHQSQFQSGAGGADGEDAPAGDAARPDTSFDVELPDVIYDVSLLPEPVARMRGLIIEACKSGDIEKLRPLIGSGDSATRLLLGELDGDPIEFLRQISGDDEGHEIMAILLEIMESGFVHLNEGTDNEYYAWPYFFAIPLDELTPPQKVELFTLLTASDYEEMQNFGAYVFYRAAITPEGRWVFFVAGD